MTREENLMYALNDVDALYVEEALFDEAPKIKRFFTPRYVTRYAMAALCAVMLVVGVQHFSKTTTPTTGGGSGDTIVSPITEYDTLEQAEQAVGYTLTLPDAPEAYDHMSVTVIDGELLEVRYYNDDETDLGYTIRKAPNIGDISGDYNDYANTQTLKINECEVTLKGNDDTWSLATWSSGNYSCAVMAEEHPMSLEAITHIISQIQ